MTRKTWVLVIASVLVSSILPEGQVFAEGDKKIVVFLGGTLLAVQQTVVALSGSTVVHTLSFINALAIELPVANPDLASAFLLNQTVVVKVYDDLVVSVNPIIPALPQDIPSTETYDWGLTHIRVDVAHQGMPEWNGQGVKVAIVDTGVGNTAVGGCTHPDLPPYPQLIAEGFNALPGGGSYCDNHGHGTHIAGIIAAQQNTLVIKGAAPQASIVPVKVLAANGKGQLSDLINGLQWVYDNPQIQLVNMSLGFSTDSQPLKDAIQKLFNDHGTIMVASAGNRCSDGYQSEAGESEGENCDTPQTTDIKYPAHYQWVLAVTAIDINYLITT